MNTADIGQSEYGNLYYPQANESCIDQVNSVAHSTFKNPDVTPSEEKYISSRTCSIVGDKIKSKEKYRKIVAALAQAQSLKSIDVYSSDNMALALEYCNIDTIEEALRLDLRIIPPGPVFYTWAAIHETSIFDTRNNPKKFSGLNYVAKIKENSNRLAQKKIPVMVVFSECEMSQDQVVRMKSSFSDDSNIVVLSVESDLKYCLKKSQEIFEYTEAWGFLDALRIAVIRNAQEVLITALDIAERENKEIARVGLMREFASINYTDMDNTFLEQSPDYIISRNGLYSFPVFSRIFSLQFIEDKSLKKLPSSEARRIKKHQELFSGHPYIDGKNHSAIWNSEKISNSFLYIFSGKARMEFMELLHIVSKVEDVSFIQPEIDIWEGDNGLISVKFDAIDLFMKRTSLGNMKVNFFEKPENNKTGNFDTFYSIAHSLVGIQLWRTFEGGHDGSWHKEDTT